MEAHCYAIKFLCDITGTCFAVAKTNEVSMEASAFGTSAEVNNKIWLAACTDFGHGLLHTCAGNPALHFSS